MIDSLKRQDLQGAGRAGVALLLMATVFFFAAWPPLMALFEEGIQGAFKYFASDSFYYLAIAKQSTAVDYFSFDGVHPTNAFHPLWEVYLRVVNAFVPLGHESLIFLAAGSSVLFSSVGTALFSWAVLRLTGRFAIALLASVPGLFFLVMPHFGKSFAAQWNFMNGMESPLSVFFFGLLLVFLLSGARRASTWTRRDLALLSIILSALMLTRLDDIFLILPFGVYALYSGRSFQDKIARGVSVALIPTVTLLFYLVFNQAYAGNFLPTSGLAKAEPGMAVLRNAYALFTTVFPFLDFMRPDVGVWKSEGWRVVQMIVPMGLAGFWLYRFRHSMKAGLEALPLAQGQRVVVVCLASYVILKAVYNFAVVGLWNQGNWYYVVSIMVSNLILALFVSEILDRARVSQASQGQRGWLCRHEQLISAVAAVLLVMLVANSATYEKRTGKAQGRNYQFWSQRADARDLIDRHCGDCGVVSFDDGIVAFSLEGIPTMNGLGLALDEEARIARDEGRMLELAWERGHRLMVIVNYPLSTECYTRDGALRAHRARNAHLSGQSLEAWEFELAFALPGSNVNFVRFTPQSSRLTRVDDRRSPKASVRDESQVSNSRQGCSETVLAPGGFASHAACSPEPSKS